MNLINNKEAFFELLRGGLWEQNVELRKYETTDWAEIMRLAEAQSVVGLVAAGFEHVKDVKIPQEWALQFIGQTLQIEQRNKAMNVFIAELIEKLRRADVYTLLVKGQGIAQCYERSLWRASGDVDLLLDTKNYEKAKTFLSPLADSDEPEVKYRLHKAYHIGGFEVELHGNMRGRFLKRVDCVVDDVQVEMFEHKRFRNWQNGDSNIMLPAADEDIIFVFAHILQHFFIEGIGLRQFCDLARLIWTYRNTIDVGILEKRLSKMEMMTEWKTIGALLVDYLGMPANTMPLYSDSPKWRKKADGMVEFIMETGNFGHNRDTAKTYQYPFVVRKIISLVRHTWDGVKYLRIFPLDAMKIWMEMIETGVHVAVRGE